MTPNNGQTGNTLPSQDNINDIAMFSTTRSTNLTPENSNSGTTTSNAMQTPVTPAVPTPTNDINFPVSSVETSTTATTTETVTSSGGTVIRVEFPSSILVYVNITNSGQLASPTVDIVNVDGTVETATVKSTIDTSTLDTTTVEASTVSSTVEISTVEVSTAVRSTDLTTVDSTFEMSTSIGTEISLSTDDIILMPTEGNSVEPSTTEASTVSDTVENIPLEMLTPSTTLEIPTTNSTVEMSTADSTVQIPTVDSAVETFTLGSTVGILATESVAETSTTELPSVEILTESTTNAESSSLIVPTTSQSSTEEMRYIQININLSDNGHNGDFGVTTQPSVDNLGQLQNKMVFKRSKYFQTMVDQFPGWYRFLEKGVMLLPKSQDVVTIPEIVQPSTIAALLFLCFFRM